MNDLDNQQARAEAVEQVPRALRSARRAHLWAGLNRYLAAEAVHARKATKAERDTEQDAASAGPRPSSSDTSAT